MSMKVYCDESGYTGAALLDREQPFFALASTCLEPDACGGWHMAIAVAQPASSIFHQVAIRIS